jgi:hypothetical protein
MRVACTAVILAAVVSAASAQPAPSGRTCPVDAAQLGNSKNPEPEVVAAALARINCVSGNHLTMTNIAHQSNEAGQLIDSPNTYYSRLFCARDEPMDHPTQPDGRNSLECTYNGSNAAPAAR